jgi:hypothetical protein
MHKCKELAEVAWAEGAKAAQETLQEPSPRSCTLHSWVDRFCITQDNEQDKARQVENMD